jgi:hypothetical protein
MFPTSIKGTLVLSACASDDVPRFLSKIRAELESVKARHISLSGNKISFRGGVFRFVSNWNVLCPVGSGVIEVIPGTPPVLRYHFSCLEMLVVVSLMVLFLGLFLAQRSPIVLELFLFPVLAWLWLFGMNYLTAAIRLPRFVRRAVDA